MEALNDGSATVDHEDELISSGPSRTNTSTSSNPGSFDTNLDLLYTGSAFDDGNLIEVPGRVLTNSFHIISDGVPHPTKDGLHSMELDEKASDIVFVHGLAGDHESTWTCGSMVWPKMLAEDFGCSRILSFKYDRAIWTTSNTHSIVSAARHLLYALTHFRLSTELEHRDIIWVAHSLGGCLVKAAIAISRAEHHIKPMVGDIYRCTRGIVFFGTPHRTRTALGWHSVVERIQAASPYAQELESTAGTPPDPRPKVPLMKLLSAFESSLDEGGILISSCFERHETGTDRLATLVTSADNALYHPKENIFFLDGNHTTMCQLQSRRDEGFQVVTSLILQATGESTDILLGTTSDPTLRPLIVGTPSSELEAFIETRRNEETTKGLSVDQDNKTVRSISLKTADLFLPTLKLRRLKRILTQPAFGLDYVQSLLSHPEPVTWIYRSQEYKDWTQDKHIYLLVLIGSMGTGKSAMAYNIASHLEDDYGPRGQREAGECHIVLHHFFSNQSSPENHFTEMLHQFLLQLLEIDSSLVRHFPTKSLFARRRRRNRWIPGQNKTKTDSNPTDAGGGTPQFPPPERASSDIAVGDDHDRLPTFSDEELTEILFSMLRGNPAARIFLVIDGLDECTKQCDAIVKQLLRRLRTVPNAKVCVTYNHLSLFSEDMVDSQRSSPKGLSFVTIETTSRPEHARSMKRFAESELKSIVSRALENGVNRDDEAFKRMQKQFVADERLSFLWVGMNRRVFEGIRSLPYLEGFIHKLYGDDNEGESLPDIESLANWVIDYLITHRERLAVLALFYVALATRPMKPEELSALLAVSECRKHANPAPEIPLSRQGPMATFRSLSPSLSGRALNGRMARTPDERKSFWAWINSGDSSGVGMEQVKKVQLLRPHLESLLNAEVFQLLTFQGQVVSLAHPYLKQAVKMFLQRRPSQLEAVQRDLAASCLTLLCLPSRSDIIFRYEEETKSHTPSISQYGYAMRSWFKHVKEAAHLGRDAPLHMLVREVWMDSQFQNPLLQLSGKKYPPHALLGVSSLLAIVDADQLLQQRLIDIRMFDAEEDEGDEMIETATGLPTDVACAAANASYRALKALIKLRYKDEKHLGKDSDRLLSVAEATGDAAFFQQVSNFVMEHRNFLAGKSDPPPGHPLDGETPRMERLTLKTSEVERRIKLAVREGKLEDIKEVLAAFRDIGQYVYDILKLGLQEAVRYPNVKMAKWLLDNGADINAELPEGESMLHLGAKTGHLGVVKLLVEYRARRSAADGDGLKPIHLAALHGYPRLVEYLLSSSADRDTINGTTPLFEACRYADLPTVQLLLSYGASINLHDRMGHTPLHYAASAGAKETVRYLLVEGADPSVRDQDKVTPLHLASFGGWEPVVATLLSSAAPVDARRCDGQTALHLACRSANPTLNVVARLVSAKANPNIRDDKGHRPLYLAIKHGSLQLVTLMLAVTTIADMDEKEREDIFDLLEECRKTRPESCALVEAVLKGKADTKTEPEPEPMVGLEKHGIEVRGF